MTAEDRFAHSRSTIEAGPVEKVIDVGWSRTLVLFTFSTGPASIVDLECGNLSKSVADCQNESILQAETTLGPLGTQKRTCTTSNKKGFSFVYALHI